MTFPTISCLGAITLVFVLATVLSVFFGYRQRVELLAIPVSTLFAFPQLRSSMPGAPLGGEIILLVCLMAAVTQRCFPVNLGTIVGEFQIMLSPPFPLSINYSSCRLHGGSSLSCLDVYMCTLSLWGLFFRKWSHSWSGNDRRPWHLVLWSWLTRKGTENILSNRNVRVHYTPNRSPPHSPSQ